MLKLHTIFLRNFLLIFLGFYLFLGILSYFLLKETFIEHSRLSLLSNIDFLSLNLKNINDIDEKVNEIKKVLQLRITIINKDGVVIAESDKDKALLENHLTRAEIIQAKFNGYGSSVRYSDTLHKNFLYVAKKTTINGEIFYLRIARDLDKINKEFFVMGIEIGGLFIFFLIISFFVTLKINTKIEDEIVKILLFLKNLTKQKRADIIESKYSSEFYKITKLLTDVSESLSKQNKQKAKHTAKLKLSNRQKDDIISAISHEFKNPIAVISGYAQTLLDDQDINPKIREKFLVKIAASSQKMTTMIDRMRLTIRLEDGKMENKMRLIHLQVLIQNQIEDAQESYPNREIIFESEDIVKEVDETLFGIAIINLIENALKYSQDRVYVKLSHDKISVRDTGIGIAQQDIERITKKFYRVSTNGWNNSLGVGLSLVSNIVAQHNFRLNIQSIQNEGSTFEILFSSLVPTE